MELIDTILDLLNGDAKGFGEVVDGRFIADFREEFV